MGVDSRDFIRQFSVDIRQSLRSHGQVPGSVFEVDRPDAVDMRARSLGTLSLKRDQVSTKLHVVVFLPFNLLLIRGDLGAEVAKRCASRFLLMARLSPLVGEQA